MSLSATNIIPLKCHICTNEFDIAQGRICSTCSKFTWSGCIYTTSLKSYLLNSDMICKDCYNRENNLNIDK